MEMPTVVPGPRRAAAEGTGAFDRPGRPSTHPKQAAARDRRSFKTYRIREWGFGFGIEQGGLVQLVFLPAQPLNRC